MPAALTAALAGVLAAAALAGAPLLVGGVAVVVVVLTLGAVGPADVPGSGSAAGLALLVGLGSLAGLAVRQTPELTPLVVALGPSLVAAIALQMLRRDGRARLTASLTLAVTACALAVLPSLWVALRASPDGVSSVLLGLVGVGVAGALEGLPGPRGVVRVLAVLAAGAAGAALSTTVTSVGEAAPPLDAVVLATFAAVATAASAAAVDRIAAEGRDQAGAPLPVGEPGAFLAAVVPLRVSLPFVVAAPMTFLLGRVFVG